MRDGCNHLSTDEFDACLAIVVCRIGSNTFAHLGKMLACTSATRQIWNRIMDCGPSEGETYKLNRLPASTVFPNEVYGPIEEDSVHAGHRDAVVHYRLDTGQKLISKRVRGVAQLGSALALGASRETTKTPSAPRKSFQKPLSGRARARA